MEINKNMIIKTLFLFVILFALAFSVSAAIEVTPVGTVTVQDGQATGNFLVKNTDTTTALSNVEFNVNSGQGFTHTDATKDKITSTTFSPTTILSLAANSEQNVGFTVTIPSDAYAGTYSGDIKAFTTTPVLEGTNSFSFEVPISYELGVSNNKIKLEDALIGRENAIDFTLSNEGNKEFTVSNIDGPNKLYSGTTELDISEIEFKVQGSTTFSIDYEDTITVTAELDVDDDQPSGVYTNKEGQETVITFGSPSQTKQVDLEIKVSKPKKELTLPASVILGSSDQERKQEVKQSFKISNTGDVEITGISVEAGTGTDNDYQVKFRKFDEQDAAFVSKLEDLNIVTNDDLDIEVQVYIPESQDSGEQDIGSILIKSSDLTSDLELKQFILETESKLDLEEVIVSYEDPEEGRESDDLSNGGSIKGVLPGTEVVFTVSAKSLFDDRDTYERDIDIKSVKLEVNIDRVDDGSDMDEDDSIGKIEPDDESEGEVTFDIPRDSDIDDDGYDITITVTGEDDKNAEHTVEWTAHLFVEKYDHMVEIRKARFRDATVEAGDYAQFEFEVQNFGEDEEEEVAVVVECSALGISKIYTDSEIGDLKARVDKDSSKFDDTFEFEIKEDYTPGDYKFKITSYYDEDEESETKYVDLKIAEKAGTGSGDDNKDDTGDKDDNKDDTGNKDDDKGDSTGIKIHDDEDEEQGFTDSTTYFVLLSVLGVLLLAILILLIVKFFV